MLYSNALFALALIRIDELTREAKHDRLASELRRSAMPWRSSVAHRLRGFADWLEPRIEPSSRTELLRAT